MKGRFSDFLNELDPQSLDAGIGGITTSIAALGADSKYRGGTNGALVGSALGAAAGAFVGMPGMGQKVGSAIGTMVGNGMDRGEMINDNVRLNKKRYGKLNMDTNVNPYGTDGALYMKEGGITGDPGKGNRLTQLSAKQIKKNNDLNKYGINENVRKIQKEADKESAEGLFSFAQAGDRTGRLSAVSLLKEDDLIDASMTVMPQLFGIGRVYDAVQGVDHFIKSGRISKKAGDLQNKNLSAQFYAEGGMIPEGPQKQMINIEKDEMLVDPTTLKVMRKYDNPNRYKRHSKDPLDEHMGNFTLVEDGMVVIPKDKAKPFEEGDMLSRKSIMSAVIKQQMDNPEQNAPRTGDAEFAQQGMIVDPIPTLMAPKRRTGLLNGLQGTMPNLNIMGVNQELEGVTISPPPNFKPISYGNKDFKIDNNIIGYKGPHITESGIQADIAKNTPVAPDKDYSVTAARALNFLPTAIGLANAGATDPYLQYDENTQLDRAGSYISDMETAPNIEASKASIRNARGVNNRNFLNINSPSTRAEAAASNIATIDAENNLIQNASNMSMEARNRKRQALSALKSEQGRQGFDARSRFREDLRMDSANKRTMIQSGASEGVTNYAAQVMDNQRLKAVNAMTRYYNIDPTEAELLIDNQLLGKDAADYMDMRLRSRFSNTPSVVPPRPTSKSKSK